MRNHLEECLPTNPMTESNPYQSPLPQDEQPVRQKRFGAREQLALLLWCCWIIGLLLGLVFAVIYFVS